MATSGSRDVAKNVLQIITQALRKIQVGVGGETLATEYTAIGIDALNTLLRSWAADGVRLWLNETQNYALVDGTSAYTLSPRVLEVYQAYRRASNNDVPVRLITREEYARLPDKTTEGAPTQVWVDRRRTSVVATVWPVPGSAEASASMALRLDVKRQIEDVTATSEDVEFPPEWLKALVYNLAVEIAPDFNKVPSPLVLQTASDTYDALSSQDREGSVFMRVRGSR